MLGCREGGWTRCRTRFASVASSYPGGRKRRSSLTISLTHRLTSSQDPTKNLLIGITELERPRQPEGARKYVSTPDLREGGSLVTTGGVHGEVESRVLTTTLWTPDPVFAIRCRHKL